MFNDREIYGKINDWKIRLNDLAEDMQVDLDAIRSKPYRDVKHHEEQLQELTELYNKVNSWQYSLQRMLENTPPPLIKESDPELERLLAEEEEIEHLTHHVNRSVGNCTHCQEAE